MIADDAGGRLPDASAVREARGVASPDGLKNDLGVGAPPLVLVAAVLPLDANLGNELVCHGRFYIDDEMIYLLVLDCVRHGQRVSGVVGLDDQHCRRPSHAGAGYGLHSH